MTERLRAQLLRATMSRQEAAEYLGVSPAMLDRIAAQIGPCHVGRRVIYRTEDLNNYLSQRRSRPIRLSE
ncbi:MAG: helix-turn-helix domain-containing protein [Candidatus Xenobia bacterium]